MDWPPIGIPSLAAQVVGQQIHSYTVGREIGRGGMAVVFEAQHQRLGPAARAAVKFLAPHLAVSPEHAARFSNEARAASLVLHPGVVRIIDFGQLQLEDQAIAYILMEYLDGESLWECFCRLGRSHTALWSRLARQIATTMAAVHNMQIVHRDLKPMNVMLLADPDAPSHKRVKIVDFGIAKLQPQHYHPDITVIQTATGTLLGTPLYMSPEQCARVESVDGKSDVYSLGATLYQLLAGRPLFPHRSSHDLIVKHMSAQPESLALAAPTLPDGLVALVHAMLDKLPSHRPTMAEVAAGLAPWENEGPVTLVRPLPRESRVLPPVVTLRLGPVTSLLRRWIDRLEHIFDLRGR